MNTQHTQHTEDTCIQLSKKISIIVSTLSISTAICFTIIGLSFLLFSILTSFSNVDLYDFATSSLLEFYNEMQTGSVYSLWLFIFASYAYICKIVFNILNWGIFFNIFEYFLIF